LRVLAIHNILLPIEEPRGDLELFWVLDDCYEAFKFVWVKITSTKILIEMALKNINGETYRLLRSTSAFLQTMFE